MAQTNLDQLLKDLRIKVESLKLKLDNIYKDTLQEGIAFELRKNDIRDQINRELLEYPAQELDIKLPEIRVVEIVGNSIDECLEEIYCL